MGRKWKWTPFQLEKLEKVKGILQELDEYKPLTLRQIYYQMVGKGYINNKLTEYHMLSDLLSNARYDGFVEWDVMEDRVRRFVDLRGFPNVPVFVMLTLNRWLDQYSRDLMQEQENYIELWTEKDALATLLSRVCYDYSVPVVVCRGYNSTTFMNDFRERVKGNAKGIVLLYFGDYDPTGMAISELDLPDRFNKKLDLSVFIDRIALRREHTLDLYSDPDSVKDKDPRTPWFRKNYGDVGYELDALQPGDLEGMVRAAIEKYTDADLMERQRADAEEDYERLGQAGKAFLEAYRKNDEEQAT